MPVPTPPDPARTGPEGELRQDRYVGARDLTRWTTPLGRWLAALFRRIGVLLGPHRSLVLILAIGAAVAAIMTWLASEVYEAVVEADGVERVISDAKGGFCLPLRWQPPSGPVAVTVDHPRSGLGRALNFNLPLDLTGNKDITIA